MTTSDPLPDSSKWQQMYSATESRWKDVERIGTLLLPIIALIAVIIAYVLVGYGGYYSESLVPQQWTWFSTAIYILKFILIIFAPVFAVVLGLIYTWQQAAVFMHHFYRPAEDEKIAPLIQRRLLGVIPVPPPLDTIFKYPSIVIQKPSSVPETHWTRWLGGPANLIIFDGIAVYLERGNRFSRVVGPNTPPCFLEQHERIKEVVDLRPQIKTGMIDPWTKDGIRVQLTIRAEYQIYAGLEAITQSTSKSTFAFDPLAVKNSVEQMVVKVDANGDLSEVPWLDGVWGTITSPIGTYITGHTLDELFYVSPTERNGILNGLENNEIPDDKLQNNGPRDIAIISQKIRKELKNMEESLAQNGLRVLDIQIIDVKMPDEVKELRKKYWGTAHARVAAIHNSRAEADRIRIREQAHADAQRTMLSAITQRLEKLDPNNLTEPLILSLSGLIDQGLDDPIVRPLIAKESFAVLERVRRMLDEGF